VKDKVFVGASLLAAVAASLCCVLPIIFALVGAGILGASAFFAAWRPELLGLTFILLGLGFYFAYRKPKTTCAPGALCENPGLNRRGRTWLWIATALVLLFATFPFYSGVVAEFVLSGNDGSPEASGPAAPTLAEVNFIVEGLGCASCARSIESKLKGLRGVEQATVSYKTGKAEIRFDPGTVTVQDIEKAIRDEGYRVRAG
jgi:mercuric ion transport protein